MGFSSFDGGNHSQGAVPAIFRFGCYEDDVCTEGFSAAGRCSNSAGTMAGIPAVSDKQIDMKAYCKPLKLMFSQDESPYFSRGLYFGQVDSQGQTQGQWIGGN